MSEADFPAAPMQLSRAEAGPFHSLPGRLGCHLLTLALLLVFQAVSGSEDQAEQDETRPEELVSQALSDTPYINSLLIGREIPILGGRWGWEMFVDAPLNDEPEGAEITLRRAKAAYARGFGNDWRIKLTADYTQGGGLQVSDTYASYSGWDRSLLTIGITDPPFSLESISQSSALTFMERGLPVVALAERRSGGVFVLRRSPSSIFNASLMLFNVTRDNLREDGQGMALHYAHSPIDFAGVKNVHLGVSLSYRINASEDNTQFRSRPEVATVDDYYVDTGPIASADRIGRVSLEASQVTGRFSWQSELLATRVHRKGGGKVDFWGAYAFVSWFLTEDSRNYNFGSGSYERVRVRSPILEGGKGAWEVALRASYADLTDQDVIGGRQKNLSIGLNWYLNDRIRLMSNVIKVLEVDRPGSAYDGLDPLIFSLRAQWVLD